jgi:hypothetical protein
MLQGLSIRLLRLVWCSPTSGKPLPANSGDIALITAITAICVVIVLEAVRRILYWFRFKGEISHDFRPASRNQTATSLKISIMGSDMNSFGIDSRLKTLLPVIEDLHFMETTLNDGRTPEG